MTLPNGVFAAGWIPFVVVICVTLLFSWLYINYFKSKYDSDILTTITASLALSVTLFTTFLVPVDIFLVSFMKNSNGTFKDWAADASVRQSIEDSVLYAYYALYIVVMVFIFLLLPFVYFFYEEKNELSTACSRLCGALKYTVIFILIASVLIVIGSLVPLKEAPPGNGTEWEKIEFLLHELGSNKAEDILSFVLSILTVIGMFIFVIFGGYGMSALPCGMIKGSRSIHHDEEEARDKKVVLNSRAAILREKYPNGAQMSSRDRVRLYEIEEELRILERQEAHILAASQSWLNKCFVILRPFAIFGGVALTLIGLLIFLSLLITNIDKAMNSLGPRMGYALPTRNLPNPIDIVFVYAQKVFPLDYILFAGIVAFLLSCGMSALRKMGIWFLWIRMYRIRRQRTRPQGLLLMCCSLMFFILALNVVLYSITPQYIMYGSQLYWSNHTEPNAAAPILTLQPCTTDASPDDCILSRTSMLLTRFCFKAWIFGATYYWATWAFLLVVVIGSIVSIFKKRSSLVEDAVDRDDFDESDEELLGV